MSFISKIFNNKKHSDGITDPELRRKFRKINKKRIAEGKKPFTHIDELTQHNLNMVNRKRIAEGKEPFVNVSDWLFGIKDVEEHMAKNTHHLTPEELEALRKKYNVKVEKR